MYHRVTLVILAILVLLAIRSTWSVYQKMTESSDQRRVVEQKSAELSAHDKELRGEIASIKTEQGLEQEIRSKFSVSKENENVVIVLDDPSTTAPTSTPKTLWQKFLNIFGF